MTEIMRRRALRRRGLIVPTNSGKKYKGASLPDGKKGTQMTIFTSVRDKISLHSDSIKICYRVCKYVGILI